MRPVLTKVDFYRRFYAGEFGNRGPIWMDLKSWEDAGRQAPVMIRSQVADGTNFSMVAAKDVPRLFRVAASAGHQPTINLQCPEHDKTLTGEVCITTRGMDFIGSRDVRQTQRTATRLQTGSIREHGLRAHLLLKQHMDGSSWDWLNYLLKTYVDHTVEFTTFRNPWGVAPGMNTIFWEVRLY